MMISLNDMRNAVEQRLSGLYLSIESSETSKVGFDSCADRFTQIINDVFDSHCCKRQQQTLLS